jgi:hypothetical protein
MRTLRVEFDSSLQDKLGFDRLSLTVGAVASIFALGFDPYSAGQAELRVTVAVSLDSSLSV